MTQQQFNYLLTGTHPILQSVNRRCLTLPEAENVRNGLEAVGYEVTIQELKEKETHNGTSV